MAKRLYVEAGGVAHKVKKLYTEVGGVSRKVKKLYAEVNGLSKLVYNSYEPFAYSFSVHPHNADRINYSCYLQESYAGYNADGSVLLRLKSQNEVGFTGGEPCARLQVTFLDQPAVAGKTVTITYNKEYNSEKSYNEFWYIDTTNGSTISLTSLAGNRDGNGITLTRTLPLSTNGFAIEIRTGGNGLNDARITITSIKLDGVEVLR